MLYAGRRAFFFVQRGLFGTIVAEATGHLRNPFVKLFGLDDIAIEEARTRLIADL